MRPGPGPWRAFFANSGAEVVEAAVKLARMRTGRQKIVAFYGAFHGRTYGALTLTASKPVQRRGYAPLLPEVLHTHYAYCYRCPVNRQPATCNVECLDLLTETMFSTTTDPARDRGGDRGARAGRRRLRGAAPRLPPAPARDHPRARHPPDRGRGAVRHGAHGPPLRERALRAGARHHHPGQGHRLRDAPGRAAGPGRRHALGQRRPRLDLRGQSRLGGGRARHLAPARGRAGGERGPGRASGCWPRCAVVWRATRRWETSAASA